MLRKNTQLQKLYSRIIYFAFTRKDIIDSELLNALLAFQKLLSSNVKAGLLGRSKCLNVSTTTEVLNNLISDLTGRISSLENILRNFLIDNEVFYYIIYS